MLLTALIFIILGILIKYGKMYFLIAGYNTMTAEEKAAYDINKIATLFKNVMFGMAAIILIGYFLSKWLNNSDLETYFLFGAILIGVPYLLIKSNSKEFKINNK